ncbi:MAG: ferrochelatase [Eggerthellaceae bacterium]
MRLGVLLMNTGTADEPTVPAIRAYLNQFLMDPAIISAPYPIRRCIVNRILKTRPEETLPRYKNFYIQEGSPFILACAKQAALLQQALEVRFGLSDAAGASMSGAGTGAVTAVKVVSAMRYGNPSLRAGLKELWKFEADQVVLLPAYPQEVRVCTGTCLRAAKKELARLRRDVNWSPRVAECGSFYADEAWRKALAQQVEAHWDHRTPDGAHEVGAKLLVSFHSTLLKDIQAGDPYEAQVQETVKNLGADLGIPEEDVILCYQSRFDNRKWLQPLAPAVVRQLAEEGVQDVAVVCPGFVAENMESALEIGVDLRNEFQAASASGARLTYIPCLNNVPGLVEALANCVMRALV